MVKDYPELQGEVAHEAPATEAAPAAAPAAKTTALIPTRTVAEPIKIAQR
jgi:hypothetical protein